MLPASLPRSFPGVDLLRALAALMVLVYHVILIGNWQQVPTTGLGYLLRHGWTGVDLFFTISGFVIALSALDGVRKQGPGFRRAFAVRRLARILPLYLLTCVVFIVLVQPAILMAPLRTLAMHAGSHLLFVHNLFPATHGSINGPSWSVGLEMQFYLAMMLAAPWLARASALRMLLYAIVLAAGWRTATTLVLPPGTANQMVQFIYATQLPGVIDEFALGIALALVVDRNSSRVAGWLTPGWLHFATWLTVAIGLLGAAAWLDLRYFYWNHAWMVIGWRLVLSSGFAGLLAAAISFPWAGQRVLAPLRYLGDISYGLYLWHMLVLTAITTTVPQLAGAKLLLFVLCGTGALAALSWHLLEKPNLLKYKGPHNKTTPGTAQ